MVSHTSDGVQIRAVVYQQFYNLEPFRELVLTVLVSLLLDMSVVRASSVQSSPLGLRTRPTWLPSSEQRRACAGGRSVPHLFR